MTSTVKYVLTAVIGLIIGAASIFVLKPPHPKVLVNATCATVLPAANSSNAYGIYLWDNSGGPQIGVASVHFYNNPGGFRHNIAIQLDPSSSSNQSPTVYDLGYCQDGTTNGQPSASFHLNVADGGNEVSVWTFTTSPDFDSSASFGVMLTQYNGSGIPSAPMSGDAYLMK